MGDDVLKKIAALCLGVFVLLAFCGCCCQAARPLDMDPTPLDLPQGETGEHITEPIDIGSRLLAWSRLRFNLEVFSGGVGETPQDATGGDLWDRIRSHLEVASREDHPAIDREARRLARHPNNISALYERGRPYLHYIVEEIGRRGMPAELAVIPAVESGFQPEARSEKGAAGIWQFMPSTGRRFGLEQTNAYDGRCDIRASTQAALDYLARLHEQFEGDWLLALAAYNAGTGTVLEAIQRNRRAGRSVDFWSLPLPSATRHYVPRILAMARLIEEPDAYGLTLPNIPNEPYFAAIPIRGPLNLAAAADAANISPKELRTLNAGLRIQSAPPAQTHHILVPRTAAARFRAQLAARPGRRAQGDPGTVSAEDKLADADSAATSYKVRIGDTLSEIAAAFEVTVYRLARWNGMSLNDTLYPGQELRIPPRSQPVASADLPA